MSYLIIRVYSFECDGCGLICDLSPTGGPGQLVRAHRELSQIEGWTITGRGPDRKHLCPKCAVSR